MNMMLGYVNCKMREAKQPEIKKTMAPEKVKI